jgi:hypothetical protein
MTVNLDSTGAAATDKSYHWLPIETCPLGVKVQLKGKGGVAVYGTYSSKDSFWVGWAPLPTEKKETKV